MDDISLGTQTKPLRQAALAYGARGWPVFPLWPHGKQPLTKHGLNDASRDARMIARWWARYPAANIGLACGPAGLVVIDVDPAHGGSEAWARIDPGVRTLISRSGGGGFHHIYAAPAGAPIRSSAGRLGPGLDVRAAGGYIVLPPSIHPSGQAYAWVEQCAIATLPDALAARLRETPGAAGRSRASEDTSAQGERQSYSAQLATGLPGGATPTRYAPSFGVQAAEQTLYAEVERVRRAPMGTRHDTLIRAAFILGRLIGSGALVWQRAEHYLLTAALASGLPLYEARRTIADGLAAGRKQPRTASDDERGEPLAA